MLHVEATELIAAFTVDQELSAKFESELSMEQEMRDQDEVPVGVQDFLDTNQFQVRCSSL